MWATASGTLNAARVPRIVEQGSDRLRNFVLVSLHKGLVAEISLVWLGTQMTVISQTILYQASNQLFSGNIG